MNDVNWALARKRQNLEQRARILQQVRAFFIDHAYLEVETPHRLPGNAPEPHIDAVASAGWALQTSPELSMKRLLASGHERLFQICRCWRDQERGRLHLPEFTLLEWYRTGIDYHALMSECEDLFRTLVPEGSLSWQGKKIDIAVPWERLTVRAAFEQYASIDLADALQNNRFEEVLTNEVESNLGQDRPTFLTEYPAGMAALARMKPTDPTVAERFELYLAGIELANAYAELTAPEEQRQRFVEAEQVRRINGKPAWPSPEKFLAELTAMPEAAGIALGIDRLVMLLTGSPTIDAVVAFTPEQL